MKPDDPYMRQWTKSSLVQAMACRLCLAKQLSEPMMCYCQSDTKEKMQWNLNENTRISYKQNAFENIVQNSRHFVLITMC